MRVVDVTQGSPEWLAARLGKVGASMVADVTARTKTGWGASRESLKARLVVERLTGKLTETYVNAAMQHGIDTEPQARTSYAFVNGLDVKQVGLVLHPTIDGAVASPDGLVGEEGLVEIKCPQPPKHLATLLSAEIDGGYVKQMQWQMACTGRQWVDFVSFNPSFPAEMQMHVRRVARDEEMISELERHVKAFLDEVAYTVDLLSSKYGSKMEIAA